MRILCLHGKGTSGDIFKSQTAALRAKLDASFVFDFVDGPFRSPSAPGIDKLFGSGTYMWWPIDTVQAIGAAHQWLDEYIEAHGPYDALMGFSQGCILIASYLMHRAREMPLDPAPPFKGAIFVCGGISYTSLQELGVVLSPKARAVELQSIQALHKRTARFKELASQPEKIQRGEGLWDDTSNLVHDPSGPLPPPNDVFGIDFTDDSLPSDIFITIPTVHVYGGRDPRYPSAIQLAHFCNVRSMYDHEGGHDIPRTTQVSVHIAELISQLAKDLEQRR